MSAPALRIRLLDSRCRIPEGSRVGPTLTAALGDELVTPLGHAVSATGLEGYWLFRRLDVSTGLGADWTPAQMASTLARAVADAIRWQADRVLGSEEVVWFPDRQSFVAGFLLDLARGRTGGRWEYAEFASSPDWHQVATGLAATEPAVLCEALCTLSNAELDEVCERVYGDRLLESLAAGPGPRGPALSALRQLRASGRLAVGESTGLLLAVEVARTLGLDLAQVAAAALEVAAAVRLVIQAGSSRAAVLDALAAARWADVVTLTGSTDAFLPLVRWAPDERAALVDTWVDTWGAPPAPGVETQMHTRFGGALLLLPLLPGLWSWPQATATWPEADGVAPHRLVKLGVLAASLGATRFHAVLEDPVLRTALGVPGHVNVRAWLDRLDPVPFAREAGLSLESPVDPWMGSPVAGFLGRAAMAVLRDLGRRLPGMAAASPSYLWHNVLDLEAWVHVEESEAVVELGHSPLSVLLAMTGLSRTTFELEGVGERRWTLTTLS